MHKLAFGASALIVNCPMMHLQAIDPGQFMKITKFAAVFTHTRTPVSNFAFRSDCWNGGYRRPGTQLAGSFRNSRFQFHFSDGVGGDVFNFKSGSASNWLSKNEMAARAFSRRGRWCGCLLL